MNLIQVAYKSLLSRKLTVFLTILSIAISVMVLLGIEHIKNATKTSFGQTISGTDLIVGARTGEINLLLYSVFHLGNASNNISYKSYQVVASSPLVDWSIPISLGDSHKGHRVVGTSTDYFKYYQYGQKQALKFAQGKAFAQGLEVVLGSAVAAKLNYKMGDNIILSHGMGKVSFSQHDAHPFKIVGILKPTGTPVDQSLYVSLESIEVIHVGWDSGQGQSIRFNKKNTKSAHAMAKVKIKSITAMMVGLKNKVASFKLQRQINTYRGEALMAILPGVALSQLWQMMGLMEKVLSLIAFLVLLASLLGMSTMLLASMQERRRELAVFRSIGAPSGFIFWLIECEAMVMVVLGCLTGIALLSVGLLALQSLISNYYGLYLSLNFLSEKSAYTLAIIVLMSFLLAMIPSFIAYKKAIGQSLNRL